MPKHLRKHLPTLAVVAGGFLLGSWIGEKVGGPRRAAAVAARAAEVCLTDDNLARVLYYWSEEYGDLAEFPGDYTYLSDDEAEGAHDEAEDARADDDTDARGDDPA